MSVRTWLVFGGLALGSLALSASGCGEEAGTVADGASPAEVDTVEADLVTVTPTVELTGLGEGGALGSVYVDDLLMHVSEIRLIPVGADPLAGPVREYLAEPIWIAYNHEDGATARGLAPIEVPAGEYKVSLTLAPSRYLRRTAGELNEASVVVRGTCIVVEQIEEEDGPSGSRIPGARNPGFQSNNPVPMPAKPGEGGPRPSHADMRTRLLQVPFSVKTAASITINVAETLDLTQGLAASLTIRLDVPAWVEGAIHPMVAQVVRNHRNLADRIVELDFASDDAEGDPMAEILAEILEKSLEGALSAEAGL
jgi:hypothetical protein